MRYVKSFMFVCRQDGGFTSSHLVRQQLSRGMPKLGGTDIKDIPIYPSAST